NFDPSLSGQEISLTSGEIVLDKSLDIEGQGGAHLLFIAGWRAFEVRSGATVTIANVHLSGVSERGGASFNDGGSPTLAQCWVRGFAVGPPGGDALGGGIYNAAGALTVNQCDFESAGAFGANTFSGDRAGNGLGGAIYNAAGATLTIKNSQFHVDFAQGGI